MNSKTSANVHVTNNKSSEIEGFENNKKLMTQVIFNDLKILNLQKLNEYLTSSFMFRYFHLHNLPEIFTDYFVTNKDIHNYNTRNAALLHKKFSRTNYNKHTLANKGTDVWSNLPSQYKEIRSFPIFKATMKKYFLNYFI